MFVSMKSACPEEVKYYVDEEKKIVVCTLEGTKYIASRLVSLKNPWFGNNDAYAPEMILPNRFVGKAYCAENDEFDVEKGKLLAYHRAKYKLTNSIYKRVTAFAQKQDDTINKLYDHLQEYFDKVNIGFERRTEKIKDFMPIEEILPKKENEN